MDAETLEREYNPRVTVADPMACFRAYQAASDEARLTLQVEADIRYGDGPNQALDVYPAAGADAPVHLFFHGGYWRSQDKRDYAFVARRLVAQGVTTVVANYDLCPSVPVATIELQALQCLDFVWDQHRALGIDPRRISVSGHSAGGQLAMRLLRDRPDRLAAVTAISGVFDLEPLIATSINQELRLDEATARAASPMHWIMPASAAPAWLVVGGDESEEFRRQTRAFAARIGPVVSDCAVWEVPGANHFDVLQAVFDRAASVLRLTGGTAR